MAQVVIDNPILNSPFSEPTRHFKFDDQGITNEVADGRRSSGYVIPIAQPKKRGKQLPFETEWTSDRYKESADTGSWEQKLAQSLEEMPEVSGYVKNQSLGFTIP